MFYEVWTRGRQDNTEVMEINVSLWNLDEKKVLTFGTIIVNKHDHWQWSSSKETGKCSVGTHRKVIDKGEPGLMKTWMKTGINRDNVECVLKRLRDVKTFRFEGIRTAVSFVVNNIIWPKLIEVNSWHIIMKLLTSSFKWINSRKG